MGKITEEEFAEYLHRQYEEIAKEKGWKTQESTQVDFKDLPEKNKEVMLELSQRILARFKINAFGRYWK